MRSRLLLATVLLFVTSVIQPDVSTAVTPAGGRVMLTAPLRGLDTRDGGSRTTGPIGLAGLGRVWVTNSLLPGTATIYPCADTPGPDPSLIFDAHETVLAKVASSIPMCIVSSVPVDFVEDILGSVSATPFVTGLQYVALPNPVVVFQGQTAEYSLLQDRKSVV